MGAEYLADRAVDRLPVPNGILYNQESRVIIRYVEASLLQYTNRIVEFARKRSPTAPSCLSLFISHETRAQISKSGYSTLISSPLPIHRNGLL